MDRTMLPGGAVWNLVDFIPDEIQAAASGRGGWTYLGGTLSGATQIKSIAYYPDTGTVYATDQAGKLWNVGAGTSPTGTINAPTGPPWYHRGALYFPNNAATTVSKWDGTNIGTVTTPQGGKVGCAYKDHSVVANSVVGGQLHSNRVWFSAAGDPTTWDANYGWWDTTGAVTAVAPTTNALLIFHGDTVERLRGTTPPPGSDMILEPFFNDGCVDPFSVAFWGQRVVWASSRGIYLTDGASVVDLTQAASMKTYWTSLMSGYSTSWRVAAGIYRDHYIVSINNGSTLVDCLCVSLTNRTIWRFTNINGGSFVNVTTSTQEKLYMGQWNAGRVGELSSLWTPGASVKNDADGTTPTPIIETGAFRGYDRLHRRWIQSMGLQKWRWAYVDYDLRDAASDNPSITLSYATTPGGAYTTVTGGALPETTDYDRALRSINPTRGGAIRSNMLEFKVAVNGPYATCNLYTLEAAFEPIEIGRLQ